MGRIGSYKFEVIETVRVESSGEIESITIKVILTNISNRKITYRLPTPKLKLTSPLPAYHPGSYLLDMPKIRQHCEWAGNRETGKLWMFASIPERDQLAYWFTYERNRFPLESGKSVRLETTATYITEPRFSSWSSSISSGHKPYYGHLKPRPAQFIHRFQLSTPSPGSLRRHDLRVTKDPQNQFESGDRYVYEWVSNSEVELIEFRGTYRQPLNKQEALKQLKP